MPRESKRNEEWDGLFEVFDREFEDMREHMDRILELMLSGELTEADDPLIYGFSMRLRPDGQPVIQEFGSAKQPRYLEEGAPSREPLTDIMESDEDVRVIMELPGVEKKDLKVQANERSLDLEVVGQEKRFRKHLELPCDVLPDSAKANYKNGVLEIVLKRHAPKRKGREVRVE